MDDVREALASFVIDSATKAREGEASEAMLQAMASVANTLLWDEQQRLYDQQRLINGCERKETCP